jgi:FHS family glucose/mannose:H+ symporter-like MFS transporter
MPRPDHAPAPVRMLTASAFAGMFVFGVVMAILGAVLPSLFEKIGFGAGAAGNLFLSMNFAMLVMTVFFGPLVDRFGFKTLLLASSLLVAASFLLLAGASTYPALVLAVVVLGFGGGGLNGGTNALTSDINEGERRGPALNVLGIFFGFGALTIPFLKGTLLASFGLRTILLLATALGLVPLVLFAAFRFPRAKQPRGFPLKEAAKVARDPLLWICGFLLFFQSGNEFTLGGWISTLLQKTHGAGPSTAAMVLAGYWAAVMAGRLLSARLVRAVSKERLVLAGAALALAAALVLWLSPARTPAMIGAVVIGLGFSPIYPTILAIVGENFAALTGTAFSIVIAVGLAGGMIAPWLAGRIAETSGLRQGLVVPVVNCAMIIVLMVLISRVSKSRAADAAR